MRFGSGSNYSEGVVEGNSGNSLVTRTVTFGLILLAAAYIAACGGQTGPAVSP